MSTETANRPPLAAAAERLRQASRRRLNDGNEGVTLSPPPRVELSSQQLEQAVEAALTTRWTQFRLDLEEMHTGHRQELLQAVGAVKPVLSDEERRALVKELAAHCHNGAARATFWLLALLLMAVAFAGGLIFAEPVLAWAKAHDLAAFWPFSLMSDSQHLD